MRTRRFAGRCSRHKRFNPARDGRGAVRGNCARCQMLLEIWEASLRLNSLIRKFDPKHDDSGAPKAAPRDARQMDLFGDPSTSADPPVSPQA